MKRLVELTLRPDHTVDDEVAGRIVRGLSRTELRQYLVSLRRALRSGSVRAAVEGADDGSVRSYLGGRYPGLSIEVSRAVGTGAGVRLASGDDVLDASVAAYLRTVIRELKEP